MFNPLKKVKKLARHPFDAMFAVGDGSGPTPGQDGVNVWGGRAVLDPGTSWEQAQDAEVRFMQQPQAQQPMPPAPQPMQGQVAGMQGGGKIFGMPGGDQAEFARTRAMFQIPSAGALDQLTGAAPVTKPLPQAEAGQQDATLAALMGEQQAEEQRRRRAAQAQMFGGGVGVSSALGDMGGA